MPRIIDNRTSLDKTVRIFDAFYAVDLVIGSSQYDVVHGYFTGVCDTKNIADNFTAVLFRIAQQSGTDVLTLLDQVKGSKSKLDINKTMCYYLNSIKSKTSLYGVAVVPRPVAPVARNIVQ